MINRRNFLASLAALLGLGGAAKVVEPSGLCPLLDGGGHHADIVPRPMPGDEGAILYLDSVGTWKTLGPADPDSVLACNGGEICWEDPEDAVETA